MREEQSEQPPQEQDDEKPQGEEEKQVEPRDAEKEEAVRSAAAHFIGVVSFVSIDASDASSAKALLGPLLPATHATCWEKAESRRGTGRLTRPAGLLRGRSGRPATLGACAPA